MMDNEEFEKKKKKNKKTFIIGKNISFFTGKLKEPMNY